MLKKYSIPKNEFITWVLSNKSWKLLSVTHRRKPHFEDENSEYVWITESGRIVSLETKYYDWGDGSSIRDGSMQQTIDRKLT